MGHALSMSYDTKMPLEQAAVRGVAVWLHSTLRWHPDQGGEKPDIGDKTVPKPLAGVLEHPALHAAVTDLLRTMRSRYKQGLPQKDEDAVAFTNALVELNACQDALEWLEAHTPKP